MVQVKGLFCQNVDLHLLQTGMTDRIFRLQRLRTVIILQRQMTWWILLLYIDR